MQRKALGRLFSLAVTLLLAAPGGRGGEMARDRPG